MRWLAASVVVLWAGCAHRPLADPLSAPRPPLQLGVDLHLHFTMSQAAQPLFSGEPGGPTLATRARARLTNQIGEAQLHAAGLRLALGAVWPPFDLRPGRTALDEAVHQLQAQAQFALRRPGFAVVHSAEQARTAAAHGRIAILPQLEGAEGITSLDDLDRLWVAGVRVIILVHLGSSALGGGAKGQLLYNLLGIKPSSLEPLGLTALGRAVVERMIALGIVIDLAHASDALTADVLGITGARAVPVINSHTGSRTLLQLERNLTDANATRIARGGGLIGVTVFDLLLDEVPDSARWPGFQADTCDEAVAHWVQLASVAGADALALGSDFNGFITRHRPGGSCPHGLRNVGDLPDLFAALEAHGIPRPALDGMGERLLKLVEVVEARADPAVRAAARRVRTIDPNLFDAP